MHRTLPSRPSPLRALAALPALLLSAGTFAGNGTFGGLGPGIPHAGEREVVLGDFDGDGHLDLASVRGWATEPTGDVRVELGNGDGTFGPVQAFTSGLGGPPGAIAAVDLDGDGVLDLVVGNDDPTVSIHRGQGDGTFVEETPIDLESSEGVTVAPILDLEVVDFDGDGHVDLLGIPRQGPTYLVQFRNDGAEGFELIIVYLMAAGAEPWDLGLADIDGDGDRDVAALVRYPGGGYQLRVWLAFNGGSYGPAPRTPGYDLDDMPNAVCGGDLDGDGREAFILGSAGEFGVRLMRLGDDGLLTEPEGIPGTSSALDVTTGDFDGNGALDLATTGIAGVEVILNEGDGLLVPAGPYPGGPATRLTVGDVDGDGLDDVVQGGGFSSGGGMTLLNETDPPTPCPADLDGSNAVDFGDLLLLLSGWGTPEADVDGDGATGFGDLLLLLSTWGDCVGDGR